MAVLYNESEGGLHKWKHVQYLGKDDEKDPDEDGGSSRRCLCDKRIAGGWTGFLDHGTAEANDGNAKDNGDERDPSARR